MGGKFWKKSCLFVCGITIGFFLEIVFFEANRFRFDSSEKHSKKSTKVTCLILLKHNHLKYVNSSRETWLKNCDEHHVVNVERSQELLKPATVRPNGKKSCSNGFPRLNHDFCLGNDSHLKSEKIKNVVAKNAWSGLCKAILHVESESNENDWLLIVPDNLIVLMENLKLFVRDSNPNEDHYYGYGLEHYEADYNVLSAGILMSRGALKKLLEKFRTETDCDLAGKHWRNEDFYLGKYLKEFGILPKDTRDVEGRGRFHGFNINNLLNPGTLMTRSDYVKKALFPVPKEGFNCCSPYLITLDVSDPDATYKIYFFLYKLKTIHESIPDQKKPQKADNFFWKDFLREKGYSEESIENMSSDEYYQIWEKIIPPERMYSQMRNFMTREDEGKKRS